MTPVIRGSEMSDLEYSVPDSVLERYLALGLRLNRHVEGVVDSYFGPQGLVEAVEAMDPVEPAVLRAAAEDLLAELGDGWLRDQVVGLRTFAGVLSEGRGSYQDEVEGCFGVRPEHTPEHVFGRAHEQLDELLPGAGPLADRYADWEESMRVPVGRVEGLVREVVELGRDWVRHHLLELPDGEGVDIVMVRDVPWMAFCEYLGELRSRISVNLDLPLSAFELLTIALHETYPGHHTERAVKDDVLVRRGGMLEESIVLMPTPQSLVSEGIAGVGPRLVLESSHGEALEAVIHDAGIDFDLRNSIAIRHALEPCRWAEVNAALMLHEDSANEAKVGGYLQHWGLMTPELAAHTVRFLKEPTSRTYTITYPAGREICDGFVAGSTDRLASLLQQQFRVRDLVAAVGTNGISPPSST